MEFDRHKSLEQLEGHAWPPPSKSDTSVVKECLRLRRIPLREFSPGDLRISIGQNISLKYLVPIALEQLRENPLIDSKYYPGDLLVSLLSADAQFWPDHPELRDQLIAITEQAISSFSIIPEIATKTVTRTVTTAYKQFRSTDPPIHS